MTTDFRLVHAGFDNLDVSFQGHLGKRFLAQVEAWRQEAQEAGCDVDREWHGVPLRIAPNGVSGYSLRWDTGPDGETWMAQRSDNPLNWRGIRVSCSSLGLVTHGLEAMWDRISERLELFGATICDHSISRVDFALDFVTPTGWLPDPGDIVAHYRATRSNRHDEPVDDFMAEDFHTIAHGRKITSITVGKLPGKQLIIYNKRYEAVQKRKTYWFDIWGTDRDTPVWRIEVRAGKEHLKDDWQVCKFHELQASVRSIYEALLSAVRLTVPSADTNVSRRETHPLWQAAMAALADQMQGEPCAAPDKVREVWRQEEAQKVMGFVTGCAATWGVIAGLDPLRPGDDRPAFVAALVAQLIAHIDKNPHKFGMSQKRAADKRRFLDDAQWWRPGDHFDLRAAKRKQWERENVVA